MKYHILFFQKFGKMLKNLLSAAGMIGPIMVNIIDYRSLSLYFPYREYHMKLMKTLKLCQRQATQEVMSVLLSGTQPMALLQ